MAMVDFKNLGQLPRSSYLGFVCSKRQHKKRAEGGISVMIRHHAIIAASSSVAALVLWGIALLLSQEPVSQISNILIKNTASPGGSIILESSVFRKRLCATKIERTIFDGANIRWVLSDIDFSSAPGPLGHQVYRQSIPVPNEAEPGDASLYFGLVWNCPFSIFQAKEVIGPLTFTILRP